MRQPIASTRRTSTTPWRLAATGLALAFACGGALAEKPEWAGKGHGPGHGKPDKHARDDGPRGPAGKPGKDAPVHVDIRIGGYFGEPQRVAANQYYVQQFRGGHCPPGLAKKHNGCLPPGQARKYVIGRPLPAGVVYYPVPQPVLVQLGAPPAGYKYVRVATDILLIAVGTSLVVDAIQDLGRI